MLLQPNKTNIILFKKIFFSVLIMFLSLNIQAQKLNIYPTIVDFQLSQPGSVQTQTINITNNSEITQAIEANFGDWDRNADGSHSYFEAGTTPKSCAKWVSLNTSLLEVGPGETKQLIVTMQAPDNEEDLKSMKWAMLFVTGSNIREPEIEEDNVVKTQINEIIRLGIHLYQTPVQLNLHSAVAQSLDQNTEDVNKFDLTLENNGQVMVRTKSYLELTNITTGAEFRSELEECPIFPLGKRKVSLHLPKDLPQGKYSMLAIMDYGDPNSLEAIERIIEIK